MLAHRASKKNNKKNGGIEMSKSDCHWCNGNGCDVCNYTGEELDY